MRTIKEIILEMEALTETARVDDASHSRHQEFQRLMDELQEALKKYGTQKRT